MAFGILGQYQSLGAQSVDIYLYYGGTASERTGSIRCYPIRTQIVVSKLLVMTISQNINFCGLHLARKVVDTKSFDQTLNRHPVM